MQRKCWRKYEGLHRKHQLQTKKSRHETVEAHRDIIDSFQTQSPDDCKRLSKLGGLLHLKPSFSLMRSSFASIRALSKWRNATLNPPSPLSLIQQTGKLLLTLCDS